MVHAGSLIWIVAGASLLGVVTRVAIPPATWLALAFLLHGSRAMPPLPGIPYMCLAVFVALAIGHRGILQTPGPAYLAIVAFMTMAAALPFALDRIAAPRLGGLASTLVFPLAWVAAEFLRSRLTSAATWGSIAYTQYGLLPVMQLAAVVGIWGITFLVVWCASTVEFAWSRGFEWSVVGTPVMACAAVLGVIVAAGSVRVSRASGRARATLICQFDKAGVGA